jgi:hypothetical protein
LLNFCGFVEELVINDDPEYQWIDKIRTPRTSNETRQKLFSKLSGELQRRIGLKVLDMDANCVLGYLQNFDLEGEHGIVVRGIGTAAYITKQNKTNGPSSSITSSINANINKNTQQAFNKMQTQASMSNSPTTMSPKSTSPAMSLQQQPKFNFSNSAAPSSTNNE